MKLLNDKPVLTDSELFQTLSKFDKQTRLAILLTLNLDITPKDIIKLTWSKVRNMSLNKPSVKILNAVPRHIFSDLIFWNNVDDAIIPLHDFPDSVILFLEGITLTDYRLLFKGVICVEDSSRQFIRIMSKSAFDRT